jgi:hypothetical protein
LSDADIERIYQTALDVLENIGIGDPISEILEYALPGGCTVDDDNRLRFPRSLVEDLIAKSPQQYPLYAPNPDRDLMVRGEEVLFCTSGEAVCILDYESQRYRPTKLVDLYDAARLGDQLDHIHKHDMNIAYAELAGTDKSFALGISVADHIDPLIELFDTYLGQEGGFAKRPFCTFGGCPIVSPLRFGQDGAEVMVKVDGCRRRRRTTGWSDRTGRIGGRPCPVFCGNAGLPVRGQSRAAGHSDQFRHVAVHLRFADGVVFRGQRGRGAGDGGNRPALQPLWFHDQRRGGHDGCEDDGRAGRLRKRDHYRDRRIVGRQSRGRLPGHCRQPGRAVIRGHGHRQRPSR